MDHWSMRPHNRKTDSGQIEGVQVLELVNLNFVSYVIIIIIIIITTSY